MKVAIINGSPRGENSTTMQLTGIIKNEFDTVEFSELPVGAQIKSLEKNESKREAVFEEIRKADALIWSFPIYVLLVPSQIVRFFELIQMDGAENILKGKYASSISTSFNFFDHTAHTYMREVCEDLGSFYYEGFSASAMDLGKAEMRQNVVSFAREFFCIAQQRLPVERTSVPVSESGFTYRPENIVENQKKGDQSVLVLSNATDDDINLNRMTEVLVKAARHPIRVANLNAVDIRGGCMGCGECLGTAVCAYKDEFMTFFTENILPADGIIYAATINKRYISATWKKYFDRNFVNGHRPILHGRPMGFLFSGPLRQVPNLREIFTAHTEVGRNPLIGFQTDECADDDALTNQIRSFAEKTDRMLESPWMRPPTFLGVGGHKIFRDLIYGMRTVMVEDHKYYTEQGLYDFPE